MGTRIELAWPDLRLGQVLEERDTGYNWVYVGSRNNTVGSVHYFVCEGQPAWVYKCAWYQTLEKKFWIER